LADSFSYPSDLCILLSTWDKQQAVSAITHKHLNHRWPDHPPVFTCGCCTYPEDVAGLTLKAEPRDWISIHRDACADLLESGFKWTYLILDDHAPIGQCHVTHLNQTLPRLAKELDALYIGLNGWGQGRPEGYGTLLTEHSRLEAVGDKFDWKYSLHPGLWNLTHLHTILRQWADQLPLEERTAWKFERMGQQASIQDHLNAECLSYRVDGIHMRHPRSLSLGQRFRLQRARTYAALRSRFQSSVYRHPEQNRYLYRFYDGPYPLFWSGLLQRGEIHQDCKRFLALIKEEALLQDLNSLQN
jgi:hypothetical protein